MGMLAGIASRSVHRSSSNRKALSVPRLMCTTLRTGRRLLVPPGAGTSRTTWLPCGPMRNRSLTRRSSHGNGMSWCAAWVNRTRRRATVNGMFSGVWADDNFGSTTTLRIQSKAPSYTFTGVAVGAPNSVTLTLTDHLGAAGTEGDWELLDAVSPVMTEGARRWIRDLASQFAAAGILASFAFSMEVYNPPAAMRAKYLHYAGGVVSPGQDVFLGVPSHQMHFGTRVRNYARVTGEIPTTHLVREMDADGEPFGYRKATGIDLLGNLDQQNAYQQLKNQFSFKEAKHAYGKGDQATCDFLKKCMGIGILRRHSKGVYGKVQ
jgi:hypothetical protein